MPHPVRLLGTRRGAPLLLITLLAPLLALVATTGATAAPTGDRENVTVSPRPVPARVLASFPHRSKGVGAPRVSRLTPYGGPCTITKPGTVISRKWIACDLEIRAANVTIRRSLVHGTVSSGEEERSSASFRLIRSTVDVSPEGSRMETGVGAVHFKVIRSEVRGGNRGINCWYDCVIRRSYVHGQDTDPTGVYHESGIRMGQLGRIVGNAITCDAPDVPPDAGCSAGLTGYGDFGPVRDNLIKNNLFLASTGGTCAYGGSSGGKPYSDDAANIRFIGNIFERGETGSCGFWAPIVDFDQSAPGNVWQGNRWTTGRAVRP